MKILLTGASGQVGSALLPLLQAGANVLAPVSGNQSAHRKSGFLNLADPDQIITYLDDFRPDIVINCAAYTAVDKAEEKTGLALAINAKAPGLMADWCHHNHKKLYHISTDYVFDGASREAYQENDTPNPLNAYGRSKLMGERAIAASGCAYLILRSSWIYSHYGHNFVTTMLRLAKRGQVLHVVDDQIGNPTYAVNIANVVATILFSKPDCVESGTIYHYTDSPAASWYEFALEIFTMATNLGMLKVSPEVIAVASSEFASKAARPARSVLSCEKLKYDLGILSANRAASLKQCLVKMQQSKESLC